MIPTRTRTLTILLTALALHSPSLRAEVPSQAWAHEGSDLKPDPSIVWGRLENGVRYAIMPNAEPPKRVSVRLYVDAGSLMEEDSQQGLAHFLEHMAFNGTKNYKADEMKAYFQRLGMSFGGDTNAHTSFKETVYDAELPEGSDSLIDESLKLVHDYAAGMLLGADEIEKERGVILSEKSARDNVQFRTMLQGFEFSLPESLIPRRLPIGTEDVIKTAPRERFTSFYEKWYTPDRLTVILVGNVEPESLQKKIATIFGDLKPLAKALPDPDLGKVTMGKGLQTKLYTEKEAGETTIGIEVAKPSRRQPDNLAKRLENLINGLTETMLNLRYQKISRQENAPFLSAEYGNEDFLQFVESAGMQITCKPEQWEKALTTGEQELRRAIQYGFSDAEFAQAKASLVEAVSNAAKQAPTRRSRELANALQNAIANDRVFTHPGADLERVQGSIDKITLEDCHKLLKTAWDSKDVRIFVGGNLALENGDAKIKAAYLKSQSEPLKAPVAEKTEAFAYTDFGPAGEIVRRDELKDLGITLVTFANNVRLNLKPADFSKDTILINANFGTGKLQPPPQPGLLFFADAVFDAGGLEKHSADDLERVFAGRTVEANFGVSDEYFNLAGKTNQKDLLLQFQLLAAYLSAPGYRAEGLRQLRLGLDAIYQQMEHTPEGLMKTKLDALIHEGDPRFAFPTKEELAARTMDELKAYLGDVLKSSYLEIAVVGDFKVEDAIAAAAKTFGALPKRDAERPDVTSLRTVKRAAPQDKTITFDSKIPKGVVAVIWPTTDRRANIGPSRRLNLVASILDDMVMEKVREELGESYSPDVHSTMSDSFTGDGQIAAYLLCEGKTAPEIGKIVKEIATKLGTQGATADQLERARKPILTMLGTQMRTYPWWLKTIVSEAQANPQRLDWARTLIQDYGSITLEEVNTLAKQYLIADQASLIQIVPNAPAAETAPTKEKEAPKKAPAKVKTK